MQRNSYYTYLDLKDLSDNSLTEIKNPTLKVILGGLFLVDSIKEFRTFYANHYLVEALNIKSMPSFENIILFFEDIASKKILLSLRNNKIIFSGHPSSKYLKNTKINIDEYILDESIGFNIKEIRSIKKTEKEIKILIDNCYKKNKNKSKISRINKKYNLFTPENKIFTSIKENGYAVVPNFFKKSSLIEMKKALIKIAEREKKAGVAYLYGKSGQNQRIYNLLSKNESFEDFLNCNFVNDILKTVYHRPTLHEKYGLSSIAAHIIPPGGESIPLHIDSVVPDPIPFWMMRFIIIITLSDFTKNNGSTAVVPKSHKLCKRPSPEDAKKAQKNEIILTAPAGSLIMWDGLIWHRSTNNNSNDSRLSIIVSYGSSFFKEICGEEEHLLVVPKKKMKESSARIQSLIGYGRGIKKGAKFLP